MNIHCRAKKKPLVRWLEIWFFGFGYFLFLVKFTLVKIILVKIFLIRSWLGLDNCFIHYAYLGVESLIELSNALSIPLYSASNCLICVCNFNTSLLICLSFTFNLASSAFWN